MKIHSTNVRNYQKKNNWKIVQDVSTKDYKGRDGLPVGVSAHVATLLSGGIDSSVTAYLLHKAVGKKLFCIFIDHGLLRKGEAEEVNNYFIWKFKWT